MKVALVCFSLLTGCVVLFAFIWDSIEGDLANSRSWEEKEGGPPYPGDKLENIFWFVQITDLHISRYWDPRRSEHLSIFLKERIPAIKPDVILVTGDLTDAKTMDQQGSRQYLDEWQTYWNTIQNSGVLRTSVWLDIRGNHDAFDVPSLDSQVNYYRKYSIKGQQHVQSYAYQLKKSFGTYNFIGVDACPDPGPKRPFNFFGYLPKAGLADLQRLEQANRSANMTIWFGHYPSSTVVVEHPGLRRTLSSGIAYVCGHLHTLGNLVPQMYTYQYAGYLELELGDWKDNRIYRVMAVDHDILSFTDESFDHWPVILVTNPKHALFQVPHQEKLERIAKSTHIRVLVFSPWPVETVTVEVDEVSLPGVSLAGSSLYVIPWNPQQYLYGLHTITVYAKDSLGNSREISQPFSLDGSRPHFRVLPSFILMFHIDSVGIMFFMLSCLSVILPLYVFRKWNSPPKAPYSLTRGMFRWPTRYVVTRLKWIWMVSKCEVLYHCLIGFTIYVAIGPWFVGHLLYEHYGVVFSWGIFIKGSFIPGSITYFYGLLQILTYNIPLLLYFGYMLDFNQRQKIRSRSLLCLSWRRDWFFILLIAFQSYMAYSGYYLAYGGIALLICPVRTWSVLLGIALHWKCAQIVNPSQSDLHLHDSK